MFSVVIIGLGNIGIRHLEAALKCDCQMEIYCVDVVEPEQKIPSVNGKKIIYTNDFEKLPMNIDVAIIATTSMVRYDVFGKLINKCTVDNIIFEKVLFPRIDEYIEVDKALKERKINAWVDCSRRICPSWIELKNIFEDSERLSVYISGGNWGIACNSIHYMDTIQWFSGTTKLEITDLLLEGDIEESKRNGYIEFYGGIYGKCGKCRYFSIECNRNNLPFEIVVISEKNRVRIINDELQALIETSEMPNITKKMDIEPVYVSNTTTLAINSILKRGECDLPSWDESLITHMAFLKPLMHELEKKGVEKGICPIT